MEKDEAMAFRVPVIEGYDVSAWDDMFTEAIDYVVLHGRPDGHHDFVSRWPMSFASGSDNQTSFVMEFGGTSDFCVVDVVQQDGQNVVVGSRMVSPLELGAELDRSVQSGYGQVIIDDPNEMDDELFGHCVDDAAYMAGRLFDAGASSQAVGSVVQAVCSDFDTPDDAYCALCETQQRLVTDGVVNKSQCCGFHAGGTGDVYYFSAGGEADHLDVKGIANRMDNIQVPFGNYVRTSYETSDNQVLPLYVSFNNDSFESAMRVLAYNDQNVYTLMNDSATSLSSVLDDAVRRRSAQLSAMSELDGGLSGKQDVLQKEDVLSL